jgi:hypothetical protein
MSASPRAAGVLAGALVTAYGVWLLLGLGWANTRATVVWLVGGVVLHDAVFAPAVLLVSLVAVRMSRRERLAPWVVALVVLVPVTLLAIPELGRFGADPRNATLLDRHYGWGWAALVALVVLGVLAGTRASHREVPGEVPGEAEEGGGRWHA